MRRRYSALSMQPLMYSYVVVRVFPWLKFFGAPLLGFSIGTIRQKNQIALENFR